MHTKAVSLRLFAKHFMGLNRFTYCLLAVFMLLSASLSAQQSERILIKYAGKGFTDENAEPGAITFLRDNTQQVHFVHNGVDMWCDKAIYYENQNFIEAFSNVRVKQGDTITMTSKYVEYSGQTELAFARGDVVLKEPKSTLTTEKLYFNRVNQQAYYDTSGKVVRDSSGTVTSQIGRYYLQTKKYQFVQDVVLVNPEYTLETERLDFFTENGHAYIFGPSTITGETNKIYCERGFYDTNEDFGYFERNAKIDYDNRRIEGDSMYFDRNRSFASATNNITVTDTINNSIVKGHYAEVFREKDSVFITKRALAITVQDNDSIYMKSDTLMLTGPEDARITRAFHNVKLYKSDLAGKADSIHVNHKTGLTQLINLSRFDSGDAFAIKRRPILWNMGNQMTGDTIHLISNVKTEKLDSLKVFFNAFLISKDTLSDDGYNQIKGKELIGLFRDNELYNVYIIKNAEVIYYNYNNENELFGINKSTSGSINIQIEDNDIEEIRLIQSVDGEILPEADFPKNARKLRGFDWREDEQPTSVEDLFKDDPPLILPIIKGLEDYVPQEDFFDDDLNERIEDAGKTAVNTPNKAAWQLPKNASDSTKTKVKPVPKQKPKLIKPVSSEDKKSGN
ncbi:OstA-like protein [Winogradskyella maritima]|uniref:OstA-like protein n=1 Tax=Winogradskyella maritima TaxID=1517766 RepID=A0ABV8AKH7_9FLAO|nr:OstA-like protein [Winogradskyella maritima]